MGKTAKTKSKVKVHRIIESRTDFFYYAFRNILLVSVPILFISTLLLSVPHSSADNSSSDSISINLPVSCTMSGTGNTHSESLINGTYDNNIGNGVTTLTTYCNDKDGYIIYTVGTSNNTEGNTNLVGNNGVNIATGTTTSGDTSNWAMKLASLDSTLTMNPTFTSNFASIPSTWTEVAKKESGTVDSETGSSITTTYAVYVSNFQPAGAYSGQVKYVMLHPSTTAAPTDTIEHAFAAAGKSKIQITDPVTGQSGSFYKMQDMENAICNAATYTDDNNSIQLVDARDNKLYWITKLQDGHCWMTQNLDLDLTSGVALTSELTDLNDNSLNGAYGVGYSYDADSKVISWKPTNTTRDYQHSTGTGWSNNNNNVAYSLDPGEWYWDGDDSTANCGGYFTAAACKDHFTGFTSSDPASARDNVNKHLSVGNYYNWSAAIASDGSGSLTTSTYNNINLNPQNSICPKGWRLPTISNMSYGTVNSTSEFGRLNQLYNGGGSTDPKLISAPLWFVRSGRILSGSFNYSGSNALYWSSTVYNSINAYGLDFAATGVSPATNGGRDRGWSVRCVAR